MGRVDLFNVTLSMEPFVIYKHHAVGFLFFCSLDECISHLFLMMDNTWRNGCPKASGLDIDQILILQIVNNQKY